MPFTAACTPAFLSRKVISLKLYARDFKVAHKRADVDQVKIRWATQMQLVIQETIHFVQHGRRRYHPSHISFQYMLQSQVPKANHNKMPDTSPTQSRNDKMAPLCSSWKYLDGFDSFTNTRRSSSSPRKFQQHIPKKKGAIMVQLKIPEQLEPRNTQKYTPATWGA